MGKLITIPQRSVDAAPNERTILQSAVGCCHHKINSSQNITPFLVKYLLYPSPNDADSKIASRSRHFPTWTPTSLSNIHHECQHHCQCESGTRTGSDGATKKETKDWIGTTRSNVGMQSQLSQACPSQESTTLEC